jgi:hypothetical protein
MALAYKRAMRTILSGIMFILFVLLLAVAINTMILIQDNARIVLWAAIIVKITRLVESANPFIISIMAPAL